MNCPICGKYIQWHLTDKPCNRFGYVWFRCVGCDLYFTDVPPKDVLDKFYSSNKNVGCKRNPVRWVLSRIRAWHQKRYIVGVTGLESGEMMDIGSGNDALGWAFRKWSPVSMEYGNIEYPFYNTVTTMSHVLEHIPRPLSYLRDLRCYNQYLFIEVPHADHLPRTFKLEHLTNYTPKSLRLLLETSGFLVIDMRVLWWPTIGMVIRCVAMEEG